jgi:hypothetical protein
MKVKYLIQLCANLVISIAFIGCSNSTKSERMDLPTDDLILHYKFDGNASNVISSISDGRIFNTQLTQDRHGRDSSSYYYNGFDSYIDIGNSDLVKPELPVTISVWIKKTDSEQGWVFGNNLNPHNYMGIFLGFGDGNLISLHFGNGNQVGRLESRRSIYATDPIELSKWYHVVGIIESFDTMRLYLNGDEISTVYSGTAAQLVYDEGSACFGKYYNWQYQNARHFKGMIDDFRLYSRVLNNEEIEILYKEK